MGWHQAGHQKEKNEKNLFCCLLLCFLPACPLPRVFHLPNNLVTSESNRRTFQIFEPSAERSILHSNHPVSKYFQIFSNICREICSAQYSPR